MGDMADDYNWQNIGEDEPINYKPKKTKTMEIKTSKIKTVVNTKPFTNSFGTTIYHSLEMENGDKINIGKKNEQKPGYELTYEILETQQEYNKAKSAQKVETAVSHNGSSAPKNEGAQKMIIAQNSVTNAVNFHSVNKPMVGEDEILKTAEKFFNWVLTKGA